MRIAVKSRYTNIHGGYEECTQHDGRPSFRRTDGGAWIFHDARLQATGWHVGPSLPSSSAMHVASFFSSLTDAATPDAAEWDHHVEKIWQPLCSRQSYEGDRLFIDKDFPHSRRSLGQIPALPDGKEPEWIPVRRLRTGAWKLFEGGISPNDLLQGSIGNCWLVAAMASLAEFPDAVESLFRYHELTPDGHCEVKLYDSRRGLVSIIIDEYIPCHQREWWDEEGMPIFARPNGNDAWVLLLEKAFAKMLGSYRELSGGNCCTAFRAFTGEQNVFVWARSEGEAARIDGEWKRMQLAEHETHFVWTPGMEDRRDADSLWSEVCAYDRQSFLVACSMRAVHGPEFIRVDGLVEAHAYSLLHAVEIEGLQLLFLRNPWGNDKRWNGRWSDGDEAWARYPAVRRRLRPEFRDDGAFWIAWVDFQAIFDFVFVCPKSMRIGVAAAEHAHQSSTGELPSVPLSRTNPRRRLAEAMPERLPLLPPGSRVELMGLTTRLELNGRITEVVGWADDAGVYEVRDVPTPYWNCPQCGEINKRTREVCNVCGGAKAVLSPDAPRLYRVRPECVMLPPGTEVQVHGLVDFPELNGQYGTIVAFDRRSGRYHIQLADGEVRAIRPPHVIARQPPAKESEFGRWAPPAPDPSHIDEPDAPEEVPCASDDDLRRLAEELDEKYRLRRDLHNMRLRRGQQLLREGELRGRSLEELCRGGVLRAPMRLRFTRHRPALLRFGMVGSYLEAVMKFDVACEELLREHEARHGLGQYKFGFRIIASPGWVCSPAAVPAAASSAPSQAKPKRGGWAGWICRECGHINEAGAEVCETCEAAG